MPPAHTFTNHAISFSSVLLAPHLVTRVKSSLKKRGRSNREPNWRQFSSLMSRQSGIVQSFVVTMPVPSSKNLTMCFVVTPRGLGALLPFAVSREVRLNLHQQNQR